MSTRVTHRESQSGNAIVGLLGLVLTLAGAAVTVSAMTLCESEFDQLVYVSLAAAVATAGWVLQTRYRKSSV